MLRILKIVGVNLLVLFILTLVIELAIRAKGDTYTWTEKGQGIYVDPWENSIKSPLQIREQGSYNEQYPEFIYDLCVNKEGVRDLNRNLEKPSKTIRILGLGDSFIEGMGATFDSTIMNLIERKLSLNYNGGSTFESICGGVSGSDIFRSYNLLQAKLIKYQPDYCLILFNNTDFNDWLIKGNELGELPKVTPPSKLNRFLFRYSHLYRSFTINVLNYSWLLQSPEKQKTLWKYFVKDFQRVMEKYISLLGSQDKILFVYHPLIHEYEAKNYYLPFEELNLILETRQIPTLNILECLASKGLNGKNIYWDIDMHFNGTGYNYVADCVVEKSWITP